MANTPPDINTPLDEPDIEHRRPRKGGVSAVWLVPAIALFISLFVAWMDYASRGPVIELIFDDASGLEAGKTVIKHRNVEVGTIENVGFTNDASKVVAHARMDKDIARYIDKDASFWVVTAQVNASGISGLDTVLSGSYVEASWDTTAGEPQSNFVALSAPPLTPPDTPGLRIKLRAEDGGSMTPGSPIFFKRIQVGKIESKELTPGGDAVEFDAFIQAPYDKMLSDATRFWNASGIELDIGADGAQVRVESLMALLRGGISFDKIADSDSLAKPGQRFRLYRSERDARANPYDGDPSHTTMDVSVAFDGSIRGLKIGAPVEYRGIRVGRVTDIAANVTVVDGAPIVELLTSLQLDPSRLGLNRISNGDNIALLQASVAAGLRAKLASASLITGALYVELVDQPNAAPAEIDLDAKPYPRIPSVPSDLDDFTNSAHGLLDKVASLPIEEIMQSAIKLLDNLTTLTGSDAPQSVPVEIAALIEDIRALTNDPALKAAPEALTATLTSAQSVMDGMVAADIAAQLSQTLARADDAAEAFTSAANAAPDLIAQITAVAEQVQALPLERLLASSASLIEDVDTIASSESFGALPAELSATIASLRGILEDLRAANAPENLSAALSDAQLAAARIGEAAQAAPALLERLNALAGKANELPLDQLVSAATILINDLSALAESDTVSRLPVAMTGALEEAQRLIAELRQADLAVQLVTTLEDAGKAAAAVNDAARATPALLRSATALADKARSLPFDELVAAADALIRDLDRIASAPGAEQMPDALTAALDEARGMVAEIRQEGTARNLNNTMFAAQSAARSFDSLSGNINALVPRLIAVSEQADEVLGTLSVGSELNYEAISALRDIRDAARAVTMLADTVERQPNSLILGK